MIPYFADDHEIMTMDLPGHGRSDDLEDSINDVASLTDFIRASLPEWPDYIIGHSLGALVALEWATYYPDELRGVGALNGIYQRSPEARAAVLSRASELKDTNKIDPWVTLSRWFGNDVSNPHRRACEGWLTSNKIDQYAKAYRIFGESDGPDQASLSKLEVPAIFITGGDEPNSTPDMSRAMAKAVPVGEAVIIDGAAHMMPMTHAGETALPIRAFFEKQIKG